MRFIGVGLAALALGLAVLVVGAATRRGTPSGPEEPLVAGRTYWLTIGGSDVAVEVAERPHGDWFRAKVLEAGDGAGCVPGDGPPAKEVWVNLRQVMLIAPLDPAELKPKQAPKGRPGDAPCY
jgi:hypothetical protein